MCFEVANDLGYGASLQDFTLKLQLYQTFTVTNISKGEREYDQEEIEGMFPHCDILEITSHVIKYIKMVEAVFTVNTRLDTDHSMLQNLPGAELQPHRAQEAPGPGGE